MSDEPGIRWRGWSPQSFEEARKADKPILLRLSAVWCHWCHVMDETSDRNPEAIRLLNDQYVPIRVDIDKMPDVRERYNFGGYPTSAFLTPEGDIMTGGTYIPPEQFVHLLRHVRETYRDRKSDILRQLKEHKDQQAHAPPVSPSPESIETLARNIVETVGIAVLGNFDPEQGGFGTAPKFPQPTAVEFALRMVRDGREKEYAVVARRTLEAMRGHALWDREEKAFFRYSVTPDWSEPHFEKMLETNAGLLANYAMAGAALEREDFAATANEMRAYLESVLRDSSSGLFFGSQDADEEYYGLPLAQRRARKPPFVDRTFYADWNAMMISAYFDAYLASGQGGWFAEGLRTTDSLVRLHHRKGRGILHHSDGRESQGEGILSDQARSLRVLLSAFELTDDARYLSVAEDVYGYARRTMWDPARGQFLDRARRPDDLGLLKEVQSSIIDNGVIARALLRLAHHRPDGTYAKDFEALMGGHILLVERYGIFSAEMAIACLERLRPPLVANLVGEPGQLGPLVSETARIEHANVIVRQFNAAKGDETARHLGLRGLRAPAAFLCAGSACSRLYGPNEPFAVDAARLARAVLKTT